MTGEAHLSEADGVAAGEIALRRRMMALCALATREELARAVTVQAPVGETRMLRAPEAGLAMLRGRMGGDGRGFNLGEASVTRAAIVADGRVGHAWHLGRDREKARLAAILDALWQDEARREAVEQALAPVARRIAAEDARRRRQAAATRVNFFTMTRGDD